MEPTAETRGSMRRSLRTMRLSLNTFTLDDAGELHEIFSEQGPGNPAVSP